MAKRKAESGRRMVGVPTAIYDRLAKLQKDLQALSGRNVTLGDVIERGMLCLEDAAARQAWLSPVEQEGVLKERVRTAVIANVIMLREQVPDLGIGEVKYDEENDAIILTIRDHDDVVALYPDAPTLWRRPVEH